LWEQSYKSGFYPWQRQNLNPAFNHWFGGGNTDHLKDGTILVPGCGTSLEPLEFAKRGARVICMDIAPSAIEIQKHIFLDRNQNGIFVCADLEKWRPTAPVDIVYEQTCLCAIQPKLRRDYENFVYDSLRPRGTLFALFMQTRGSGGPPFHCDVDEMKKLFSANRWQWDASDAIKSEHPLGVTELGYVLTRH
jgi:methyl halide transferase